MEAKEIAELIAVIEEWKPVVEKAIPIIMSMGRDIQPIFDSLILYQVTTTHDMIVAYKNLGYTHEEAMTLTMWNKQNVIEALRNYNKS